MQGQEKRLDLTRPPCDLGPVLRPKSQRVEIIEVSAKFARKVRKIQKMDSNLEMSFCRLE